ncbi:MAG: hypothetical protein ABSF71_08120, partial [Terriglobia bacterium]
TFRRQLNDLPAFRTEVFDRTATPKEMLRMKEPPGMYMKTKDDMTKRPAKYTAFSTKMQQMSTS